MTDETVREIGELGLIERIRQALPAAVARSANLVLGIGDDTAVWTPPAGEQLLITTDALIEGVHFDLAWDNWEGLGWKSLAVNISDIAAMGGEPALAEISLGLPPDTAVDDVLDFYRGMAEAARIFGVVIGGGDVVGSPKAVAIGVTVIGHTRGGRFLSRSGARAGDVIAVSGTLGAAAAGLELLQLSEDDARRDSASAESLINALLGPAPRVALGQQLLQLGATSAMDLSDGLLGDLPKLLDASNVAADIRAGDIPVAAAVRALFPETWQDLALRGGEDYELLFTAPPRAMDPIETAAEQLDQTITTIGSIRARGDSPHRLSIVLNNGERVPAETGAFDHFG